MYRSYYLHQSRELVSPVCGIFSLTYSLGIGSSLKTHLISPVLYDGLLSWFQWTNKFILFSYFQSIVCLCVHFLGYGTVRLFAPTSWSRMSNNFRDSESLEEEVVSDLNILVWKWYKIATQKKLVFGWFCLTKHGGNHTSRWIRDLWSKGVLLILASL